MAYTDIDDPTIFFNTVLYTGTGSNNTITGVGFQPDWTWIKSRTATEAHRVIDSVRGATKEMYTNLTDEEFTEAQGLKSFDSDGFTVGTTPGYNGNTKPIVSWNWKAGTSFTNDASSTSVGSIDSAGSVNTDAGFSIISYTGTGSSGTIAHGLGAVPGWMIIKCRSEDGHSWKVYHKSVGATKTLALQNTGTPDDDANYHDDTEPTSSVFTVGSNGDVNDDGETFIAYLFAEKQGYSKFGSYTGTGNADGTFLYTGFLPAWIMIKATDQTGEGWFMFDNKRDVDNAVDKHLTANLNNAEGSGSHGMDFVSNGIKIRNGGDGTNTNAKNYIFMAFAENPFVTSTGIPGTAQ